MCPALEEEQRHLIERLPEDLDPSVSYHQGAAGLGHVGAVGHDVRAPLVFNDRGSFRRYVRIGRRLDASSRRWRNDRGA